MCEVNRDYLAEQIELVRNGEVAVVDEGIEEGDYGGYAYTIITYWRYRPDEGKYVAFREFQGGIYHGDDDIKEEFDTEEEAVTQCIKWLGYGEHRR